ncbi:hypothetical protein [Vibrio penaeicida]|uniref:Uncharacterized protein n=1 Tax=Vibrio penaeicida TaxID=104609 RepID=A0AAV5NV20_9VIBR|nr:hypothetical protein [Vibrio penaeicida]RTZ22738.1 hypothetical protein EKN09_12585 [Vibrio penaeicida]GLQ74063.1 hypothetical protein GCM10007932_34240 [Vibrio penaeicida]
MHLKKLSLLFIAILPGIVFAADDTISINRIFFQQDGAMAIEATTNIITNASSARDCADGASWAKRWAGFGPNASDRLVSALLSAHAQNKSVTIRTDGCYGSWHKITSVYVN